MSLVIKTKDSFQKPVEIDKVVKEKEEGKEKEALSWRKKAFQIILQTRAQCSEKDITAFENVIHTHKDLINTAGDPEQSTIFHDLAKRKYPLQFVEILVKNGIDFSIKDSSFDNTPLIWAIANGNNEMAKEILSKMPESQKKSLNIPSIRNNTALHLIIGKGYTTETTSRELLSVSNARLLALAISAGADVNVVNKQGNTPLHLAYARRDYNMVKCLIESGAKQDCLNNEGLKPKQMLYLDSSKEEAYNKAKELMTSNVGRCHLLNESDYHSVGNLQNLMLL